MVACTAASPHLHWKLERQWWWYTSSPVVGDVWLFFYVSFSQLPSPRRKKHWQWFYFDNPWSFPEQPMAFSLKHMSCFTGQHHGLKQSQTEPMSFSSLRTVKDMTVLSAKGWFSSFMDRFFLRYLFKAIWNGNLRWVTQTEDWRIRKRFYYHRTFCPHGLPRQNRHLIKCSN